MTIFTPSELENRSATTLAKMLLTEMRRNRNIPECYHEDICTVLEKYEVEKQRRNEKAREHRAKKRDESLEEYKKFLDSYSENIISTKSFATVANVSTRKAIAILRTFVNYGLLTKEYTKDCVIYHRVEAPAE